MDNCCAETCTDTVSFTETTELTERSLRRLAASNGCCLQKSGSEYTIIRDGQPVVTCDDDECWAVLEAM